MCLQKKLYPESSTKWKCHDLCAQSLMSVLKFRFDGNIRDIKEGT